MDVSTLWHNPIKQTLQYLGSRVFMSSLHRNMSSAVSVLRAGQRGFTLWAAAHTFILKFNISHSPQLWYDFFMSQIQKTVSLFLTGSIHIYLPVNHQGWRFGSESDWSQQSYTLWPRLEPQYWHTGQNVDDGVLFKFVFPLYTIIYLDDSCRQEREHGGSVRSSKWPSTDCWRQEPSRRKSTTGRKKEMT